MLILTNNFRRQMPGIFLFSALQNNVTRSLKGILVLLLLLAPAFGFSQQREDSLRINNGVIEQLKLNDTVPLVKKDSLRKPKRATSALAVSDTSKKSNVKTPRGATIRSAIIPGWGQIYNKKYWKLPLVYGALGITGYVFLDNIDFYKKIRFAYIVARDKNTAEYPNVAPELLPLVESGDLTSLRSNRNAFRKNIDYSVLFFIFFWGLNVIDATVDGHLKGFNVTDDLSMKIKPVLNYNSLGMSLVFDIHKAKKRPFLAVK